MLSDITSNELAELETGIHNVRDGTSITFAHLPKEGAPRIALVHSLAMDHRFWLPVIQELHNKAEVLAIDCRGHGTSDKAAGPYNLELFANDLADVLDHIGWDRSLVGGASLGGAVALQFAVKFPNRTSTLGLIDTTSCYGQTAPDDWAKRAAAARSTGLESMTDFQETRWFSCKFRKENPDIVKFCVDTFIGNDLDTYSATCRMLGGFDLRAHLKELTMPTAVIVGEEDYATPLEMAEFLHKEISGSTLEVIKDGRHLTPLEHPALIADRLLTLARKA